MRQGGEVVRAGWGWEFEVIDKVPLEVVKAFYVWGRMTDLNFKSSLKCAEWKGG